MENIQVCIKNENDFFDKYSNKVSREFIDYLIAKSSFLSSDVNIIIKTSVNIKDIEQLLKDGLIDAYNDSKKIDKFYDNKQIMFFIFGVVFLIFSTFVKYPIIKEITIISGWVAIWEVVDIALNVDSKLKNNRKIIKKLLNGKIEVVK